MTASLQRVTTEYDETEDRIRLCGEREDGTAVVVWLTQRLLRRLLPMLLEWLEQQGADMPRADLLLGLAQQAAQAELAPQQPVQAAPDSATWLAQAVDLTRTPGGVGLVFRGDGDGEAATLTLATTPLQQWLGIVHQAYGKAEWPVDLWPEWLREAARPALPQATVLH